MRIKVGAPKDKDLRKLLLMILVAMVLLIGQPWLWNRVFEAASRFRDRQTQELQLANVTQLTERLRNIDPAQQALIDQVDIPFPRVGAAPQIVERLEALAESKGLIMNLESIQEQASPGRKESLIPLEITVQLNGSPRNLLAFIDTVEHMQEYNEIYSWSIRNIPTLRKDFVAYGTQMKIIFYLQPN